MVKSYTTDEIKRKQRELLGRAIDVSPIASMPKDMVRIIHFPGPNNMEWLEVYKQRGFDPRNVVGIEQDRKNLELLLAGNPEIRVFPGTLRDYMNSHTIDFSIISLDDDGYLDKDIFKDFLELKLRNKNQMTLYHLAVLAKRENSRSKSLQLAAALGVNFSRNLLNTLHFDRPDTDSGYEDQIINDSRRRRDGTLEGVMIGVHSSRINSELESTEKALRLLFPNNYEGVIKELRSQVLQGIKTNRSMYKQELVNLRLSEAGIKLGQDEIEDDLFGDVAKNLLQNAYLRFAMINIQHQLSEDPIVKKLLRTERDRFQIAQLIVTAAFSRSRENISGRHSYMKYSYISESNAPMIGDIMFESKDRKIVKYLNELFQSISFYEGAKVFEPAKFVSSINHIYAHGKEKNYISDASISNMPRIFLGRARSNGRSHERLVIEPNYETAETSPGDPVTVQTVSSATSSIDEVVAPKDIKEKIRAAISSGMEEGRIMSEYGISTMQLAGHKAYLSRTRNNSNGKRHDSNDTSSVETRINGSRDFTTDELIAIKELREEGYLSTEIQGLFPEFTWQKIAAALARSNGEAKYVDGFRSMRPSILQRDDYRCQKCNITEDMHRINTSDAQKGIKGHGLHVHHINYDHEDNRPQNMIALCSGCHGMTNTIQQGPQLRLELEAMQRSRYGLLLPEHTKN